MELFHCLATHSFVLVRVATMLKILDDVFSGEIEVGNYLYWLSKLRDVYGILVSHTQYYLMFFLICR